MAYSFVTYTANGSTQQFDITFDYIDRTHIKVYLDNVEDTTFTFINDSRIQTTSIPSNGVVVKIDRDTPVNARLVDFQDGSVLTEADLDRSANQNFFVAQENTDEVATKLGLDNTNRYDANNKRIINLANPTGNQDAVTKYYLENTWLSTANKAALTTVNDNISNINAVNSNESNINTVANDLNEATSEIDIVATNITNVNTVGDGIANVNTVATNIANVNTVAGNDSNVTTVAGISGNVTTVAGISSDVTAVAADATDIGTVSSDISNVNTVAGSIANVNTAATNISNINTVANDLNEPVSEIDTVATNITNVNTVGTAIANVNTVATDISNVNSVASNSVNINTVAGNSTNINTVAGQDANITTLAAISADITSVANISTDIAAVENKLTEVETVANDLLEVTSEIDTVANSISNVDAVGLNISNVNTVAGNNTNINTVAGISGNVTTVAGVSADVTTVAGISANVTSVANDATDIGTVAGSIANVNTAATNIANVNTVAGISSDVTTVATDSSDIQSVASNSSNINTVAGAITNVNTVASNVSSVNSFAERYRVDSSDPSTSLDAGDLAFNTTSNVFKYYDGTTWQGITAGGIVSVNDDSNPQLGGNLDLNSNNITGTGDLNFTGSITLTGNVDGRDVSADGTKLDTIATSATANPNAIDNLVEDLTPELGGALSTNGNDINFGDNDKANFGASNDLHIYHNSANGKSYIEESGTGNLVIRGTDIDILSGDGEAMVTAIANGAVTLYHDNAVKLATTSTGATVTGTLSATTFSGSGASLTNIPNSALDNSSITVNGSSVSLGGSVTVGTTWESESSAFTAVANKAYFVDTSSAAVTATLPSSATIGDEIRFLDVSGTFDTNNLTVARNGHNIQGSANNLTVSTERAGFALVYYNATQGWLLKDK